MLRPYQEDILERCRQLMRSGNRTILVTAPTGSGKTILTAHMLKSAADKGLSAWFIVHRRELITQSARAFASVHLSHGIISAGFIGDPRHKVQICSIGTLARRYHRLPKPKLIVWDECHHQAAANWAKIHRAFPDSFHIGLSATPERLDGKGLGDFYQHLVKGPSVRWLIDNGYLADFKIYAPTSVSLTGVHSRMGDFIKSELQDIMDRPTVTGDAVREYKRLADGKRAVVFCVSIAHSKHVVEQFRLAGVSAEHVDGETPRDQRDATMGRFTRGEIKVLCNVDLFGEGLDVVGIEAAIMLRPTQSLALFLQQCGRALRPAEGKTHAIILDHAGNCARHGLPDDERDWSLEGREKSKRASDKASVKVKICPKCFAAQTPGKPTCTFCGEVFELKPRQVEEVEGELSEVSRESLIRMRKQEQGKSLTLEQLTELGRQRGYKRPHLWAKYVFNGRQAKKLRR